MKRWLALMLIMGLAACSPIGLDTIARDRFDYSTNITQSWQRQMLLNMVKLRYTDTPVFMDVGSEKYYDRPNITYMPLVKEKFTRNSMTLTCRGSSM